MPKLAVVTTSSQKPLSMSACVSTASGGSFVPINAHMVAWIQEAVFEQRQQVQLMCVPNAGHVCLCHAARNIAQVILEVHCQEWAGGGSCPGGGA